MNGLEGMTQVTFEQQHGAFPANQIAYVDSDEAAMLTAGPRAHMTTKKEREALASKAGGRKAPVEGDSMPLVVQSWLGHKPGDRLRLPRLEALRHVKTGRAIVDPNPPAWAAARTTEEIRAERQEHAAASGRGKKAARAEADKAKGRRGRRGVNAEAEVEETK